jgi:RNA polymerase sigma-70 factor (ECF subfamily)
MQKSAQRQSATERPSTEASGSPGVARESPSGAEGGWFAPIRAGKREALGALFHEHYGALCRFAQAYVTSSDVAEDLAQDVFVALWRTRNSIEPRGGAKAYLYASVRNRALNWLRGRDREARRVAIIGLHLQSQPPLPDDDLEAGEMAAAIRRAVQALPERARACLLLSREAGLSYEQIAATLHVSPRTVEVHIGRALRQLRSSLADILPSRAHR